MQSAGKKTFWDRKGNIVNLVGDAIVRQPGEELTADTIVINREKNTLVATGNAVYMTGGMLIQGEGMDFDLGTRTGTITNGKVSGGNFMLSGERINKLGDERYQVFRGSYSTCLDCAQSWRFQAEEVDIEIEGYAYMKGVSVFVKDAPLFWVPYLIIPVKTERQTGLLFPKFGFSNYGFRFVQPFFWALSRSLDMTFALGPWFGQGLRGEYETRYRLSDTSYGQANLWYLRDLRFPETVAKQYPGKDFPGLSTHRWAVDLSQRQELPLGIDQKLRIREVSDNLYPYQIGDVGGTGDAYLASNLLFSKSVDGLSGYLAARRTRNLINADPRLFDAKTVQAYPSALLTTNDRFLFGLPIAGGLTLGVNHFTRSGPTFDRDLINPVASALDPVRLGQDPIRKTTRVFYTPSLYTTLRPFGAFSLVPQAEYRGFFYSFPDPQVPSLSRGYLLLKADLSFQLEKVYQTSNPDRPRIKHLFRPMFSYAQIPMVNENNPRHPFLGQMDYARANGFSGYSFDTQDVVPLQSSQTYSEYFTPLGHSLTYGFVSQLITREGRVDKTSAGYRTAVELNAKQTYNFKEIETGGNKRPFSRMTSNLIFSFDKWSSNTQYIFVPYVPRSADQDPHILSTSLAYTFERSFRQQVLEFERSVSLGFSRSALGTRTSNLTGAVTFSLNDYILPRATFSKDFNSGKWLDATAALAFQSPSRCWRFEVSARRTLGPSLNDFNTTWSADLSLNLTGSGFGGVSQATSGLGI